MTVGPFVLGSFLVTEGDGLFFLAAVHLLQEVSVQLLVTVSWDYGLWLLVVLGWPQSRVSPLVRLRFSETERRTGMSIREDDMLRAIDNVGNAKPGSRDVLDKSLLILRGGLDGGSGLLLLTTAAGGQEDTTEHCAEDAHGELYRYH